MFKAVVVSRADYPIVIKYDGQSKVVSPRERFSVDDINKIEGKLPSELKLQIIK